MRLLLWLLPLLLLPAAPGLALPAPGGFTAAGVADLTYYETHCQVPLSVAFVEAGGHFLLQTTYGPAISGPVSECSFFPATWSDTAVRVPTTCTDVPAKGQLVDDGTTAVMTASYLSCVGDGPFRDLVTMVRSPGALAYTDVFENLDTGDVEYTVSGTLVLVP